MGYFYRYHDISIDTNIYQYWWWVSITHNIMVSIEMGYLLLGVSIEITHDYPWFKIDPNPTAYAGKGGSSTDWSPGDIA